jgi:hypothetical protein
MTNIKSVIEGKLGLTTMEQYTEYKKRIWEQPVSMDEIEELSPDKIDSSEFWKYCDENPEFKYDTVAFGIPKDGNANQANERNFLVAAESGVFSRIIMHRSCAFNVLDIGAGFGMLKIELNRYAPYATYYGVDVHPKFEGCIKVTDCILPPEIMEKRFGYVFACNVFQHLSIRQRRTYYEQVAKICDGFFVLTNCVDINDSPNRRGFKCRENNRLYMCHYGQFTELQTMEELREDLEKHFHIISLQQRTMDNHFCFHLAPIRQEQNKQS